MQRMAAYRNRNSIRYAPACSIGKSWGYCVQPQKGNQRCFFEKRMYPAFTPSRTPAPTRIGISTTSPRRM
ncbi:hypothetical protein MACH24_09830 [Erythrobacter sp. Dej080120_24]|nr:hypothetical protein MACH24_09830 [Erythrobacter sp. Dej080120_24]